MSRQNVPSIFGRSTPFLRSFQDELAHMLDLTRQGAATKGDERGFFTDFATMPALDVAETETALEVSAEVPGVSEDDLDVTVQGDVLIIKGEKSSDSEDKQKDFHVVERRYGSFRRQVPLGFVPEQGAVSASFDNGVLKLVIDKPANVQGDVQKVEIGKS
ncbi:Hsp20/alpha crystallin family protein [Pseudaestuariivita atlantica]|nr:Hsp20/alpha crystallin family protein [Pseudaestuariivita atlantica]